MVIDTSTAFKLFLAYGENGIDEAWALVREHRAGEIALVSPAIGAIEIANILRYLGVDEANAMGLLEDYEHLGIDRVAATPARVRAALSCALAHGISVYDALFLALAQELECELVTSDRRAFGSVPNDIAKIRLI